MTSSVHILNGFSDILNRDNVKPGVDIKDLEIRMINGGLISKTKDPQDKFNDEMREMANKLGINFGELSTKKKPATPPTRPTQYAPADTDDADEDEGGNGGDGDDGGENEDDGGHEENVHHESARTDTSSRSPRQPTPRLSDTWRAASSPTAARVMTPTRSPARPDTGADSYSYSTSSGPLYEKTLEQQRRAHINSVNAEMGAIDVFSFEKEKREDMKCQMLEEIDSLMYSLQEDDVDLSRIPKVDRNSTYGDVDTVLKMLRHKNDRLRYCSFAEEFLIFGAYGLEDLFDGKRTWFGRYRPDMTGYHNVMNVKLRRMRHDTSTLVGGFMQDYNIGSGFRLLLELVPNMVLYSKTRKQQHNEPDITEDINAASARLSEI